MAEMQTWVSFDPIGGFRTNGGRSEEHDCWRPLIVCLGIVKFGRSRGKEDCPNL